MLFTDFPSDSKRDAPFHRIAYDYSRSDWDNRRDYLRDVSWKDIFQVGAFAAASAKSLFSFAQKDKSSDSKVKFRQASNRCKRILEAAKLAYANETKESITCQKLGS